MEVKCPVTGITLCSEKKCDAIVKITKCKLKIAENWLAPAFDLGIRLWMANIFFKSGLIKINSWDETIALFEDLYDVPFLSPEVAAYMATTAELALPVLLVIGLATRYAAFALFLMVMVIQYGLGEDFQFNEHYYWMFLFLMLTFHGAGRFSVDGFIRKKLFGDCCNSKK